MPAVRPPGAVASPRRCRRSPIARLARPPSTSARTAMLASSASSAARTATPSPVGSVRVVPARTATSPSPSAISSSTPTEVARSRTDPTFGAVALAARCARLPRLRSSGLLQKGATTRPHGQPDRITGHAIIWGLSMASDGDFFVALDICHAGPRREAPLPVTGAPTIGGWGRVAAGRGGWRRSDGFRSCRQRLVAAARRGPACPSSQVWPQGAKSGVAVPLN